MKRLFTILVLVSMAVVMFSQSPEKMSYQAVIRNAEGVLISNSDVGIRIQILQNTESGNAVYVEVHTAETNENGLITIEVGGGTIISGGSFDDINWSAGPYFLKTETDPTGGTDYTIIGTSQILSVPYALHAKTVENGFSGDYNDLENKPDFTGWDTDWTNDVGSEGDITIDGHKTFVGTITVPTPVNETDAATKAYVDALKDVIYNELLEAGMNGIVNDIEGNTYRTIKIGDQIWMAGNLKTTRYRNGDLIGTTTPATLDISGETTPKYQWAYDGNESNVAIYGRLYTWYAVTDSRNVCPAGWHVPSDPEWTTLTDYLTNNGYGYGGSGSDIAKSLAATSGWLQSGAAGTPGDDQASNNSSGFTALPSGIRDNNGTFIFIPSDGFWLSSTEASTTDAYYRIMSFDISNFNWNVYNKRVGYAVRCLRDL